MRTVGHRAERFASRPSRARGLKRPPPSPEGVPWRVAPITGAWIETGVCLPSMRHTAKSRPSRARGLKHRLVAGHVARCRSRPSRARGLKPFGLRGQRLASASPPLRAARRLKLWRRYSVLCLLASQCMLHEIRNDHPSIFVDHANKHLFNPCAEDCAEGSNLRDAGVCA